MMMNSAMKIRVSNAHGPVQRPRLSRIPTSKLSFPIQISRNALASELAMAEKARNSATTSFRCRNSTADADDGTSASAITRKRLAIFVSGGGSNFRSVHEASVAGSVHGDVTVVVIDKPGCGGAKYARTNGIPVLLFPKTKSSHEGLSPVDLVTSLRKFKVDFILLAGYLKLLPHELVQAYPESILNIHPSLLPAFGGKGFYGLKVHRAVIASGARYSGPTVHFVDESFDTGRILAQRVVSVFADDTAEELAARVLHEEHKVYVEAVSALCEDRIIWREDGVPLIRSREDPNVYG